MHIGQTQKPKFSKHKHDISDSDNDSPPVLKQSMDLTQMYTTFSSSDM
jgi:hypothetical protein